jgi:hypothetical protein
MTDLRQVAQQALEQPEKEPYPEGNVVGPCICGSWPGGKCLKCPRIAPPAAQPEQEPVMLNGLTEAETNATASVIGLTSKPRRGLI